MSTAMKLKCDSCGCTSDGDDCHVCSQCGATDGLFWVEAESTDAELTHWLALNQGGEMVYVGAFETFEQADESIDWNPVWLVDAAAAAEWVGQLQAALTKIGVNT